MKVFVLFVFFSLVNIVYTRIGSKLSSDPTSLSFNFPTTEKLRSAIIILTETSCTTPNDEEAKCIPIKQCQVFLDVLKDGVHPPPSVVDFMRNSSCGFDDGPLVCCGSFNHSRELTPANSDPRKHKNFHLLPTNCGLQEVDDRVPSDDTETRLDEFPWMGLMEYSSLDNGSHQFLCGATLISKQYAVTAAHCAFPHKFGPPFNIRFGEHDLNTAIDCRTEFDGKQSYALCVENYQDIGIDRIIVHPAFNRRKYFNDIALIRLAKPVKITTNVRPVCLPLDQEKYPPGKRMFVAGWGYTKFKGDYSVVKRKISLPIQSNEKCKEVFANISVSVQIWDHQICAGGEEGVDACKGDSGNALVNVNKGSGISQWYMEGIVSYGKRCGVKDTPGVYTRVSSFVNWILDLME